MDDGLQQDRLAIGQGLLDRYAPRGLECLFGAIDRMVFAVGQHDLEVDHLKP
jgi:hypothetical protein